MYILCVDDEGIRCFYFCYHRPSIPTTCTYLDFPSCHFLKYLSPEAKFSLKDIAVREMLTNLYSDIITISDVHGS